MFTNTVKMNLTRLGALISILIVNLIFCMSLFQYINSAHIGIQYLSGMLVFIFWLALAGISVLIDERILAKYNNVPA